MMLIQSSFPSSVEAARSFVSDHGKPEFLRDWIPGAETWQKCPKCDNLLQGGCEKVFPISKRKNNDDDSYTLNFPISCSQQSAVTTMSESSTPTFVYQRRKLQRNSAVVFPAQASAKTKPSDNCLSATISEAPSVTAQQHVVTLVEVETGAARAPVTLAIECNRGALVSKSGSIDGCTPREELGSEEGPIGDMHKVVDLCCVNESCSSSKSNMDLGSASVKIEVDDTGECSSSGQLIMEGMRDDLSEKDICISFLRSQGLLEGVRPIKFRSSAEDTGTIRDGSCLRPCKVCDQSETTLKMLICDHCEEAFHVSCCNPRIKKIPIDEWFCHSCLKNKSKILKETATSKSPNISIEMGRCGNATSMGALGPFILEGTETYTTNVRIGNDFQAEVPDWSGPIVDEVNNIGEPLEMNPSECGSFQEWSNRNPSRLGSIGNWLQCREVIDGVGTICGKWRRAPLFEVQSDDWECFRSVLWDPTHSDCAVPQELDTDQVLKHLKYIEMLRPRLAARRRKLGRTDGVDSQDSTEDVRNTQTL